jgi:dihydrolipoamide dehydrogenase
MKRRIAIVGAGPGGYVAALRAAQLGAEVCLIEKEEVGGTCLNWGCIPSKVMKATADLLTHLRQSDQFGIQVPASATVDMVRLLERKTKIVTSQIKGIETLLERAHVDLIKGTATLAGMGQIMVTAPDGDRRTVEWDRLVVATGSRTMGIPGIPFDGDRILASDDVFKLDTVPASLVIVGGGAIGCEFACMLAALGAEVTLVEALDRLLPMPSVDEDCSKILAREMKKQNIRVLLNQTVESINRDGGGLSVSVGSCSPGVADARAQKSATVACEKMLVCIGRQADIADLGLETLGLDCDDGGWLTAGDRMETGVPGVYAVGDILGPAKVMLAHVASAEGIVAAENAMDGHRVMRYDAIPNAVFTVPEVANVGLTQAQAGQEGIPARADSVLFRVIGKAQAIGELAGQAKIVSHSDSGKVLGVHIIGPHATDLIAEGTLAVATGRSVQELASTIHAHPTLSEVVVETALKAADRGLHG